MLPVQKTLKLFIGGKFPRTESGRTFAAFHPARPGQPHAHGCLASRKDLRDTVEAATAGHHAWSKLTAYNRAQIIYRFAEMLQQRSCVVSDESDQQSAVNVAVYFAGFADKYQQLASTLNPVSGPYSCMSAPDSQGVVCLVPNPQASLSQLVAASCAALLPGNGVVLLIDQRASLVLDSVTLAEAWATSDLPAGAINILTVDYAEIIPTIAAHRDIRSVFVDENLSDHIPNVKELAAESVKRIIIGPTGQANLESILEFTEIKTVWQPIGL